MLFVSGFQLHIVIYFTCKLSKCESDELVSINLVWVDEADSPGMGR